MAIEAGNKVSTTGVVDKKPFTPKAPDMSSMRVPEAMKPKQEVAQRPEPIAQPVAEQPSEDLINKVQGLTDEDKIAIDSVLSPSVSNALLKIAPELKPLVDQFGKQEENIIIPVSVVKNFATKRYEGVDENEAVNNFITDLETSQMDQQTVPPDTAQQTQGMMARTQTVPELPESGMDYSSIDEELV